MSLEIAIAGAGIGGLTTAVFLANAGHRISVFDQFEQPKPVGSGLVIQPVGQDVLAQIGALDQARAMGKPIYRMSGHETRKKCMVLNVNYDPNREKYGLAIHRAALFNAVMAAAKSAGATLVQNAKVEGRDGQKLRIAGKLEGPFDLIIDATGAGSPLSPLKAKPLSFGAIWGTVPWPDQTSLPADELSQAYRRADRMLGVLPIGQVPGLDGPQTAVFWSLPSDGYETWLKTPLDQWKSEAHTLWPEMSPFLETITDHDQMTMARYAHGTLAKPYSDSLVHIGDAAHRASPQLGQGANMALLDAAALARALELYQGEEALRAYAMARRGHVWVYQAMSWAFTPQYQSSSTVLPWLRDHALYPISQFPPVPRILTRLVCGDMLPPMASLG